MRATRRGVMAVLAGGMLAPSLAGCAQGPDPAAAWRNPGAGEADVRRYALAHAILAPNPHNRQPWLVDLVGADELILHADLERLLPATDPFDRQIVLGCGAFLELLDLAARTRGRRCEVTAWPEGEPQPRLDRRPVAHVRFVEAGAARDPLVEHIRARRTNRKPYEARAVADADLAAMAHAAGGGFAHAWANGGDLRARLRTLAWEAFEKEIRTPAAYRESVDLMRIGAAEIAAHRDGLVLDGPMIEFARAVGLLNRATLLDLDNAFTWGGIEAFRPLALEAPAYAWFTSADNGRVTQVAAGRAYARLNLAATARGLSMHPWSQALQEYPEMAALHAQAETLMNAPGDARVQMFVRVGYGPTIAPSPRRGLGAHLNA